jgi:hypothetical protein
MPPAGLLNVNKKVRKEPKKMGSSLIRGLNKLKNNVGNWLRK